MLICLHILSGWLHATVVELRSSKRNHKAHKAEHIRHLGLCQILLTPADPCLTLLNWVDSAFQVCRPSFPQFLPLRIMDCHPSGLAAKPMPHHLDFCHGSREAVTSKISQRVKWEVEEEYCSQLPGLPLARELWNPAVRIRGGGWGIVRGLLECLMYSSQSL